MAFREFLVRVGYGCLLATVMQSAPVAAQDSCEANILVLGAEMSYSAAAAKHKGCKAREGYRFEQDPQKYIQAYGSSFYTCKHSIWTWLNCQDIAQTECQARQRLDDARATCQALLVDTKNEANQIAGGANFARQGGGANAISKRLTQGAIGTIEANTNAGFANLDGLANQLNNDTLSVPGEQTNYEVPSVQSTNTVSNRPAELDFGPGFQAILDGSVEDLRSANESANLALEQAQAIMNQGLQKIEEQTRLDIDRAREEYLGNQTGSADETDLEARMRRQYESLEPKSPPATMGSSQTSSNSSNTRRMTCEEGYQRQTVLGRESFKRKYFGHVNDSRWKSCQAHFYQPWEVLCGRLKEIARCVNGR